MLTFRSRRTAQAAPVTAPPPMGMAPEAGAADQVGGLDLSQVLRGLWRRRGLILGAPVVLGAVLGLGATLLPDRYTARAAVMLDPRQERVVDNQDEVVSDLELSGPILESEVAVLRAPATLRTALTKLGPEWRAAQTGSDTEETPQIESLIRDISVTRMGTSYVIDIAVTRPDPDAAADLANALAGAYIRGQLADRQAAAERATAWLAAQVDTRRDELATVEAEVAAYRRDQLVQSGTSSAVIEAQLAVLTERLAMAQSDMSAQQARLRQIQALVAEEGVISAAEVLDGPVLGDLRRERAALVRDEARLAMTLGPGHADRRAMAADRARLDRALADEVGTLTRAHSSEIAMLSRRVTALGGQVAGLETRLSDLAAADLRLHQLEREADAARLGYETLLARLGETRAQVELQRAEAKQITEATPPTRPSAPRPGLWAMFGGALGLSLALGVALLLDMSGRGYSNAAALEAGTGLPVLAVLPEESGLRRPRGVLGRLQAAPYGLFADRVRQLRTTLSLTQKGARSILLLSSLPAEGKTTAALALAQLYARAGARVVLMDLDTRRAALAVELELSGAGDLADVIRGDAQLEAALHRPEGLGFDVVATGREYGLLADDVPVDRLRAMIGALKARYDVVLIDAPPVLAVPDGLPIATAVDTVLYLVRWQASPRRLVAQGLSALQNVGLHPDGLILSMADPATEGGGYDSYG